MPPMWVMYASYVGRVCLLCGSCVPPMWVIPYLLSYSWVDPRHVCLLCGSYSIYCPTAGWTPLMYASYVGHDTIVNLLLDSGVEPSRGTPTGLTPLMVAAGCGNESVCYFLLQVCRCVLLMVGPSDQSYCIFTIRLAILY